MNSEYITSMDLCVCVCVSYHIETRQLPNTQAIHPSPLPHFPPAHGVVEAKVIQFMLG